MKKYTLLLVTAIAFLSSCSSDKGDYWESYDIFISDRQWNLVGEGVNELNTFYEYIITDKNLTKAFYNGTIDVYLYQKAESGEIIQVKLPYTRHYAIAGEETDHYWTETISFDYSVNSIAIYVEYSDFNTRTTPGTLEFRVVKQW